MRIKAVQTLFDILRGKKKLHVDIRIEEKPRKKVLYKIPWFLRHKVGRLADGALVSCDKKALDRISKKYLKPDNHLFYKDLTDWSYASIAPIRYENQTAFLKERFLPLLKKTDTLCDFGCASGEFSFMMLPYVKEIDGYDYSEKMIATAQTKANEQHLENIRFRFGDVTNMKLDKIYDAFSFLGVLTYILDDDLCQKAIQSISDHLKTGGYCVYKDNSNETKKDYFISNPSNNYYCVNRSRKKILSFFKKAGFKLVEMKDLHRINACRENGKKIFTNASMIALFIKEKQ